MRFDIRNYFKTGKTPYTAQFSEDFSTENFDGSVIREPVTGSFQAVPTADGVVMQLTKERELDDPDFELPLDEKGCLDIRELVYQELIFKIPRVLLCSPDCQGLCPICGKRKAAGCNCQPADEAAPADARLSILKQLLS